MHTRLKLRRDAVLAARSELLAVEAEQHHAEILYLLGSVDGAEALVHEGRDRLPAALAAAERALHDRLWQTADEAGDGGQATPWRRLRVEGGRITQDSAATGDRAQPGAH